MEYSRVSEAVWDLHSMLIESGAGNPKTCCYGEFQYQRNIHECARLVSAFSTDCDNIETLRIHQKNHWRQPTPDDPHQNLKYECIGDLIDHLGEIFPLACGGISNEK